VTDQPASQPPEEPPSDAAPQGASGDTPAKSSGADQPTKIAAPGPPAAVAPADQRTRIAAVRRPEPESPVEVAATTPGQSADDPAPLPPASDPAVSSAPLPIPDRAMSGPIPRIPPPSGAFPSIPRSATDPQGGAASLGPGPVSASPGTGPVSASPGTGPASASPGTDPASTSSGAGPASAAASAVSSLFPADRPEVAVGASFAGGLVLALILKRLAR